MNGEKVSRVSKTRVSKDAKKELIAVLEILKELGIDITDIPRKMTLGDLLIEGKISEEKQQQVLTALGLKKKWPIGRKISTQKEKGNIEKFTEMLVEKGSFTEDEIGYLTTVHEYSPDAPQELANVLLKLKRNGFVITDIVQSSTIGDLISEKSEEEKKKLLAELGVDEKWPIGKRINGQKRQRFIGKFAEAMESIEDFTEEELRHFTFTKAYAKNATLEMVRVLGVLKSYGISMTDIPFDATIGQVLLQARKTPEQQAEILKALHLEEKWQIGAKIRVQKRKENKKRFKETLEKSELFTNDEVSYLSIARERSKNPVNELIEVFCKLKENGISIIGISTREVLGDLLKNVESSEARNSIIASIGKNESWPIGERIMVMRRKGYIEKFKEALNVNGTFSEEEIKCLVTVKRYGQEIGKATYDAPVEDCDRVSRVMLELMPDKVHGGK